MRRRKFRHPIYRHDWDHPDLPLWQEALDSYFPRHDHLNWLMIAWEPGMPYSPVQRWVIYEMVTEIQYVPQWIVDDLKGPDPRSVGHDSLQTDDNEFKYNAWISDSFVTRRQWQLFRETGCYAKKFWIVQGDRGGHMFELSKAEIEFLEARGVKGARTPLQGDRPYVEPDGRTWERLRELDKLQTWDQNIAWDQRSETATKAGLWVRRDRVREEMVFNARLRDFLESQVEVAVEGLSRKTLRHIQDNAPSRPDLNIDRMSEGYDEAFDADTSH
jgi:hypothetical protein